MVLSPDNFHRITLQANRHELISEKGRTHEMGLQNSYARLGTPHLPSSVQTFPISHQPLAYTAKTPTPLVDSGGLHNLTNYSLSIHTSDRLSQINALIIYCLFVCFHASRRDA
jgi:hypothetical protein